MVSPGETDTPHPCAPPIVSFVDSPGICWDMLCGHQSSLPHSLGGKMVWVSELKIPTGFLAG